MFIDAVSHPDEAKKFLQANYNTKGCSCGEAVAVSFAKALQFSNLKLTSAALTHSIRTKAVGCTGKNMRSDGSSSTCVHISKWKIPQRLLDISDKNGANDETLLDQNKAVQEMGETDEFEVEILATVSSSAGNLVCIRWPIIINLCAHRQKNLSYVKPAIMFK